MAPQKTSSKSVKSKAAATARPRKGKPRKKSIEDVVDFVSPEGVPYKILKTTEMDAYDPPLPGHKKGKKS